MFVFGFCHFKGPKLESNQNVIFFFWKRKNTKLQELKEVVFDSRARGLSAVQQAPPSTNTDLSSRGSEGMLASTATELSKRCDLVPMSKKKSTRATLVRRRGGIISGSQLFEEELIRGGRFDWSDARDFAFCTDVYPWKTFPQKSFRISAPCFVVVCFFNQINIQFFIAHSVS